MKYFAALGGHQKVVELLMTHPKTQAHRKDGNGITPLDFASIAGKENVACFIREKLLREQLTVFFNGSVEGGPFNCK